MSDAGLNQLVIYAPWATYLFWSGYRLNRLKGNKSLLALLTINTIIGGLISLQAIFSILALFKYGIYRDWYDATNNGKPCTYRTAKERWRRPPLCSVTGRC